MGLFCLHMFFLSDLVLVPSYNFVLVPTFDTLPKNASKKSLIRQFLMEQSDMGLFCLHMLFLSR